LLYALFNVKIVVVVGDSFQTNTSGPVELSFGGKWNYLINPYQNPDGYGGDVELTITEFEGE
jgi:hypothetical protein